MTRLVCCHTRCCSFQPWRFTSLWFSDSSLLKQSVPRLKRRDHSVSMFLRLVKVGRLAAKVIGRHNNRVKGGVNGTMQMEIQLLQAKRTLEAQGRQLHQ